MKNLFKFLFVGVVALCMQATTVQAQKIPVPSTSQKYTVGQLLYLINWNNKGNCSSSFILENGQTANSAGLSGVINANLNTTVTLSQDPVIIGNLVSQNILTGSFNTPGSMAYNYAQILLYFTLPNQTQRFYLNDPNPPGRFISGLPVNGIQQRTYGAQIIINKYNLKQTYNPTANQTVTLSSRGTLVCPR